MMNKLTRRGAVAAVGLITFASATGCKMKSPTKPFVRPSAYSDCSISQGPDYLYTLNAKNVQTGKPVSMKHSSIDAAYLDAGRLCVSIVAPPGQ